MSFLLIVAIVAAYAILSSAWKFYRNYQDAIRSGLPVILCPVNNQSILYIIAQVPLRPILARFLPEPLFDRVRLSIFGWEFLDKGAIHERVGPAFILVTAGVNELWCADPHMAQSILSRRKDFVQLPIGSKILCFLGENILTAGNGAFGPSQFLREDEIAGNLFVFTAAGYDTTANTMTYAVGLMAAYPQWQAWLQDELDRVLGSKAVGESRILPYTTYFPKLKRCLAVMMETLRLYPALIHISRSISHDQAISKEGENYIIPGPCTVYINNAGLHHAREDWGNDAGDFRPSRWLTLNSDGTEAELITPARGTFLPWSGGPRMNRPEQFALRWIPR
ncbi:cytochrome p450 domain-containing protein [Purpureocillium lilacinum]|uniref:Cytochrome p450 domain-containing protein n=1 Tax=Purpureocillium lilacinum TaxID=33203 RepID=A0A179H6F6_PURLI|nr:cytochrome p450 domain-containing protein [Purpureocillium lilacinum]OAQ85151.1 cytochrome p450 domain-containing protein [Purpureocillium lilacinum]